MYELENERKERQVFSMRKNSRRSYRIQRASPAKYYDIFLWHNQRIRRDAVHVIFGTCK